METKSTPTERAAKFTAMLAKGTTKPTLDSENTRLVEAINAPARPTPLMIPRTKPVETPKAKVIRKDRPRPEHLMVKPFAGLNKLMGQ